MINEARRACSFGLLVVVNVQLSRFEVYQCGGNVGLGGGVVQVIFLKCL